MTDTVHEWIGWEGTENKILRTRLGGYVLYWRRDGSDWTKTDGYNNEYEAWIYPMARLAERNRLLEDVAKHANAGRCNVPGCLSMECTSFHSPGLNAALAALEDTE